MNRPNNLKYLFLVGFASLVKRLCVRPGAYSRVEHLKVASLRCALALLANIRLGLKSLSGTNTNLFGPFISYDENKVLSIRPAKV